MTRPAVNQPAAKSAVETHATRRIRELEHEAKSFEAEAIRAERSSDKRHSSERAAQCRDAIARIRSGGKG
jgi:hypothetical protein